MVERLKDENLDTGVKPTYLHLFRFGEDLSMLTDKLTQVLKVNSQTRTAMIAHNKLVREANERMERLNGQQLELRDEYRELRSSQVCGAMYLKMYDELYQGWGLSDSEFMDFFKMAVRISGRYWHFFSEAQKSKGLGIARSIDHVIGAKIHRQSLDEEVKKLYGSTQPPSWFKGKEEQWTVFLVYHTISHFYLDSSFDESKYPTELKPPIVPLPEGFGEASLLVLPNEIPDWLAGHVEGVVQRDIVSQELAEDLEAEKDIDRRNISIKQKSAYLRNTTDQKVIRLVARYKDHLDDLFSDPVGRGNFIDLILYLRAFSGLQMIRQRPSEILAMDSIQLKAAVIEHDEYEQEVIRAFTQSGLRPEQVALYLERKLSMAKIVTNDSDHLVVTGITPITDFIDSVADPSLLLPLRGVDQKTFNVLNYDLRPLIERLPGESLAQIRQVAITSGENVERVIWELSDMICKYISLTDFNTTKPQQPIEKTLEELLRFSRTWIRSNYIWATMELKRDLEQKTDEALQASTLNEISDVVPEVDYDLVEEIDEIETTITEIQEGSLSGWRLLYTDNRTTNQNHLHAIEGRTLDERQDAFRRFLTEEGIACPINPDSVMRAIEWEVEDVPPEVEQTRIRKEINGEVFKKLKRGAARIFYIMDSQQKKLTFFLYKKESEKYRF